MAIVDQSLTGRARAALLDRARALRAAQFGPETSRAFTSQQIRHDDLKETLSTWLTKTDWPKGQPVIYAISAVDAETVHRIVQALPERDGRAYRLPKRPDAQPVGPTLYVGSSENIRSRLFQHLCYAPNGTYALNLSRWCPEDIGPLTLRVQAILGTPDRQLTQDLEDALWNSLRPALGKRGGR